MEEDHQKKEREIVRRILDHLCKKEFLNISEEKPSRIWTQMENENPITNFEMLSSNRIIGLETTLEGVNITVLMFIFEQLFANDFYDIRQWMMETVISESSSDGVLYKKYAEFCDKNEECVGRNMSVDHVNMVYTIEMLQNLFY